MREIKFKFLMENGEITDTYYLKELIDSDSYINIECEYSSKIKQELQYTGLKDKNGVEIYEGDIIKVNGNLYEVWHSGLAFGLIDKNKDFFEYMCQLCDMNGKVYEVIGNIYENPELLELE